MKWKWQSKRRGWRKGKDTRTRINSPAKDLKLSVWRHQPDALCARWGVTGGHWEKMRASPLQGLVIWCPPSLVIKVTQTHNQGRLHKEEELGIIVQFIFLISFNKDICFYTSVCHLNLKCFVTLWINMTAWVKLGWVKWC